jgi:class 3 adenylate cyclase
MKTRMSISIHTAAPCQGEQGRKPASRAGACQSRLVSDSDERQRSLTGSSVERAKRVVDDVLTRAQNDGERAVSYARLALAGIVFVLWPLATLQELKAGVFSSYAVLGLCFAALCFSAWVLLHLRRKPMTSTLRILSIVVDGVLVLGLLSSFVFQPPPTSYFGLGRISGLGAAYFVILAAGIRLSQRGALFAAVLMFIGTFSLAFADRRLNQVNDTVANWVTIGALIVTAGVFAWLIAQRTRILVLEGANQTLLAERARSRLGAYVSEEVAAASLASDEMRMGGVRREVAILFSDLRNFTTVSEKADPEQLVRELNEYFEVMVACVAHEGGVVDKYIGDSIMAVFGAVTPKPDDTLRAVRAALAMERALEKLNASREKRELPVLKHGIGVHKGVAVAGNIGTMARAQYTVIGDTVNVAARLESATKDQGATVLLSQAVVDALGATPEGVPPLRKVGDVKAKGRDEPIPVHTFA